MILSSENSLDALIHHLGANWVWSMVQTWLKICMLLWHNKHRFVVLHFTVFTGSNNGFLDIGPNIRSVVPIKINDLFLILGLGWAITLKGNGVQIILICFPSDDVDCFMHTYFWVLVAVVYLITGQNAIIADLLKIYRRLMSEPCSFLEILNFRELLDRLSLGLTEISAQRRFAHSWQTNGY